MLAETIPESEFGYPNSVLAKTAPFFFCRLQGLSLRRYLHGVTTGWCALCGTFPRQRYLHLVCLFSCQGAISFLTKQKSRYTHSMYRPCKKGRIPPWQVQQIEYMYRLCISKSVIRLMAFRSALLVCARPHI